MMKEVTAQELRNIAEEAMVSTIRIHRGSRAMQDNRYSPPDGSPTEEEIDYFLFHNPLLDDENLDQLIDPGLLGYFAKTAKVSEEWLSEYKESLNNWATNNSWLAADEPLRIYWPSTEPDETETWSPPSNIVVPNWAGSSPTYILIAQDLLRNGRVLSDLNWRDFERLIGDLLESEGWNVKVTQATRDGGFDVLAIKSDSVMGQIKSVWQAKKYGTNNKVKLSEVRELSAIRDEQKATKGIIVTTNHLTKDAIEWVKRDTYRLEYKDRMDLEKWLQEYSLRLR